MVCHFQWQGVEDCSCQEGLLRDCGRVGYRTSVTLDQEYADKFGSVFTVEAEYLTKIKTAFCLLPTDSSSSYGELYFSTCLSKWLDGCKFICNYNLIN